MKKEEYEKWKNLMYYLTKYYEKEEYEKWKNLMYYLTAISRVNMEIARTKVVKVWCQKMDKKIIFSLNINNQSEKKPEITPEYCLK